MQILVVGNEEKVCARKMKKNGKFGQISFCGE
jgi:hypothetical protein